VSAALLLAVLLGLAAPPDAEKQARLLAIRSLAAYYLSGNAESLRSPTLCLAIDESAIGAEPLSDDHTPALVPGRDDDPDPGYLETLQDLELAVVPLSRCPKPRRHRGDRVDGVVVVKVRPLRWVAAETVEIPTLVLRAGDRCTNLHSFRYVWKDGAWEERRFDFSAEQCPD
jgi:hypothetical protein